MGIGYLKREFGNLGIFEKKGKIIGYLGIGD